MNTWALLLGQAPWGVVGPVLDRVDDDIRRRILANPFLPGNSIVSFVLAHGTTADRLSLADNPEATAEILTRLAECPEPEIARRVIRNARVNRDAALRCAPAAAGDPALTETPVGEQPQHLLYALVESGDAAAIAYAMSGISAAAGFAAAEAVLVRGCLNLWRTTGPEAAGEAFAQAPPLRHGVAPMVRKALGDRDGRQTLGRFIEREGRTELLVERLRAFDAHTGPRWMDPRTRKEPAGVRRLLLLAPHEPLRWEMFLHEDDRIPWSAGTLAALYDQPDCPKRLRQRYEHAAPGKRSWEGDRLPPARHHRRAARHAALGHLHMVAAGLPSEEARSAYAKGLLSAPTIIAETPSAQSALAVFTVFTGERLNTARTAIGKLTAEHLGEHIEAWAVALRLLPEFSGSLPELLRTARAAAGD
ncbi:MAG: hypothetical protein HOV68_32940 [Streptomycetaceae bacterium]|nr:hypothetical protein [Streptomycetaceae bacterium]